MYESVTTLLSYHIINVYHFSVAITAAQIPTVVVADLGSGSGMKKFPYPGNLYCIEIHIYNSIYILIYTDS